MSSHTAHHRPFLSLQNASFRLGDRLVFENTNWVFHRDEHWAIIGQNGSGKSLFADALRGKLPLVSGRVRYHFRTPSGLTAEETIGHVSFEERKSEIHDMVVQSRWNSIEQEQGVSVADFLSFDRVMDINPFEVSGTRQKERSAFERRFRRSVAWLRLGSFLDQALISLSNGERQRVELARALCHPLRLLILDEPYIGLDAQTREEFHQLLETLMGTSLRVLIITTRSEELPAHITHLLQINECQVVANMPRRAFSLRKFRNLMTSQRATPTRTRLRVRSETLNQADLKTAEITVCGSPSPLPKVADRGEGSVHQPTPTANSSQPLVKLRNITVRYGNRIILKDVDWTIQPGESWALLGPNGSGKSTLLNLIMGDNPQAYMNDVVVFGKRRGVGESIWELKKQIGWVSPELQLHFDDNTTCLDAVLSGFRETIGVFELPGKRQRLATQHWLARFDLLPLAKRPLFELSAGIQRVVFLARALAKRPLLLALDEPCQGLDLAHRNLFIRTVDPLIRSRLITAIYVTHRPDEIPPSIRRIKRLTVQ